MAYRATSCQAHLPILFSQSSPAQKFRALYMASETPPQCVPCQLPHVGVRQVGRLPRPDVRYQTVEAPTVPHFRRRIRHQRRQPPWMPAQVRKVGAPEFDIGEKWGRRRSLPTETYFKEVGAVSEWSLATDEKISVVGWTCTFEWWTLQHCAQTVQPPGNNLLNSIYIKTIYTGMDLRA